MTGSRSSLVLRHGKAIGFLTLVLCVAGIWAAIAMPASVFPHTDFPRVVVLIDNGVMPADEMMATITRPVEEAMKNIPGATDIRSATGRGSSEVNVFFDWSTDMVETELFVLARVAQIRNLLPVTAQVAVHRLTFAAFPVLGVSLVSATRPITELWERARYDINPRLLRLPGVARVKLVGGRQPEFHVIVDPVRMQSYGVSVADVDRALANANLFTPAGMHEENRQLYLSVVDNRVRDPSEIEDIAIGWVGPTPIRIRDVADVRPGAAPAFNIVTADSHRAVLFNVYGQPDSNTVAIADAVRQELDSLRAELPPDMRLALFYDQSEFVREGVASVWESVFMGLGLSILVMWLFLRNVAATMVAAIVIPITVLMTLIGMKLFGMSFNLMTLGGIAAAIGLVIDDAIVVVESIHTAMREGHSPTSAVRRALGEVGPALIGSTMTPTVVFLPLAFLDGVAGVFFRALALTMVFALLCSLVLAVTWTPIAGAALMRTSAATKGKAQMRWPIAVYEYLLRGALAHRFMACLGLLGAGLLAVVLYINLESDFLPAQDEGAFVIDYFSRPGTSLSETDSMLVKVESILAECPEVEGFSRRTGARLALAIAEPNTGDFLVKLHRNRARSTEAVIDDLREQVHAAVPALETEFPGVLGDLIGDLTWSPAPVEIKLYSNDTNKLKQAARQVADAIAQIHGVVDINDGLVVAGPSLRLRVDTAEAARVGHSPASIGAQMQANLLGKVSTRVIQGDRTYAIRVMAAPDSIAREQQIDDLVIRSPSMAKPLLDEIAAVEHLPGGLEMHRENQRQLVAVSARLSGVDLGNGIKAISEHLRQHVVLPAGVQMEFGGLFAQQQASFRNLAAVLALALVLVLTVLIFEFGSILAPIAILLGSILALLGVLAALYLTGTTLNIVSLLGVIIGVGIVAKNGILMLDLVAQLRADGVPLAEALVRSGQRRLRPVLMTSMTTFLGLVPLAWGVGAGADMLRPLAIAVIGAMLTSLLLSLVATPLIYSLLLTVFPAERITLGEDR